MKKSIFVVILSLALLFPAFVYAEEENSTRYEEIKENIASAKEKVKNYVDERRNAVEEYIPKIEAIIENSNISVDTSFEYNKEIGNAAFDTVVKVNADLENNDGILKDSNGSVNTEVASTLTINDQDLLDSTKVQIGDGNKRSISYNINENNISLNGSSVDINQIRTDYKRVNLLGKVTKQLQTNTLTGKSNSFNFGVDKTNENDKTIYNVLLDANSKGLLSYNASRYRKSLFGERTSNTSFLLTNELNYSKNLKVVTPNKNPDPVKPDPVKPDKDDEDTETTTLTTDKVTYLAASTVNPYTYDSIIKDIVIFLISGFGLLGLKITTKQLINNK